MRIIYRPGDTFHPSFNPAFAPPFLHPTLCRKLGICKDGIPRDAADEIPTQPAVVVMPLPAQPANVVTESGFTAAVAGVSGAVAEVIDEILPFVVIGTPTPETNATAGVSPDNVISIEAGRKMDWKKIALWAGVAYVGYRLFFK